MEEINKDICVHCGKEFNYMLFTGYCNGCKDYLEFLPEQTNNMEEISFKIDNEPMSKEVWLEYGRQLGYLDELLKTHLNEIMQEVKNTIKDNFNSKPK